MAAAEGPRVALVETDFLFGLRKSDPRNGGVMKALKAVKDGQLELQVLASAVLEVRTVLYSRGMSPSECEVVVSTMDFALAEHGVRKFLQTELADLVVAERLMSLHPDLGFFDSIHAAPATRHQIPILGSEGVYQRIGVPFIDLDRFEGARVGAAR